MKRQKRGQRCSNIFCARFLCSNSRCNESKQMLANTSLSVVSRAMDPVLSDLPLPSPIAYSTAAIEATKKPMHEWILEEPVLKSAISNVEYYGYIAAGLKTLHELALGGNAEARDYLDPLRSTLGPKHFKAMHAFGVHFQALQDHASALEWFKKAACDANYHESAVSYAAYLVTGKALPNPDPGLAIAFLMKAWENGQNKMVCQGGLPWPPTCLQ
ncbi:hypothetical protein BC830DRAFT_93895 [Chytriomyces sp. MP71]|nr:hypothetical protein BC830DRAFT_93895 [Chytriomyces sp. MP71]